MRGLARLLSRAEHKGTKGLPMASSLESNKIAAAVLTAGVLPMLSGFVAELLSHPHVELAENAYPIAIPEDTGGSGPPAPAQEVRRTTPPRPAPPDTAPGENPAT